MREVVLDASVIAKWLHSDGERHLEEAHALRSSFEAGDLTVFAPTLLQLEIFNIAGRRWKWTEQALTTLALTFDSIDFIWVDPELSTLSPWVEKGLSAYDACYAALAVSENIPLITDDRRLAEVAVDVALPLSKLAISQTR